MKNAASTLCFRWSAALSATCILLYLINREFYAGGSLLLLLPDLLAILLFVVAIMRNCLFWFANSKNYRRAYLPLFVNILAIVVIIYLPPISTGKRYHKRLVKHAGLNQHACGCQLYTDYYLAYAGFLATDLNAEYITDGKNFRLYIGNYNEEDGFFDIKCKGDSLIVRKTSTAGISTNWSDPVLIEKKVFSLTKLKAGHVFD